MAALIEPAMIVATTTRVKANLFIFEEDCQLWQTKQKFKCICPTLECKCKDSDWYDPLYTISVSKQIYCIINRIKVLLSFSNKITSKMRALEN